jgi:thiamine-phosphate pyrophosphorylase
MEDYARFALDDAGLSGHAKRIRHGLASALADAGLADAIRARAIVADVGREVQTPQEYERTHTTDVVIAAGKRLSEALRVIEEYGKTVSPELGRAVEVLRYDGYELERRLRIRLGPAGRFHDVRLYVLLTESVCRGDWFETAAAAIAGGADCIQLREKALTDRAWLERARRLVDLCHEHGVLFVANDRADLAVACGADGLHVGQDDLAVSDARRVLGPRPLVGVSTHTVPQAEAAIAMAPDYIAVGPMFASTTKPQDVVPGPALAREVARRTSLPIVAIGGITPDNASEVVDAGARCICVCSAVISQPDVAAAARALRSAIGSED